MPFNPITLNLFFIFICGYILGYLIRDFYRLTLLYTYKFQSPIVKVENPAYHLNIPKFNRPINLDYETTLQRSKGSPWQQQLQKEQIVQEELESIAKKEADKYTLKIEKGIKDAEEYYKKYLDI